MGSVVEASVIIATYNRAERLQACLEALGKQSLPATDFEVVVVVDGSTDSTGEMLARFPSSFPLQVSWQHNQGQCVALNHGAKMARGRICIFLDDDIIAAPALVANHLRLHQEHQHVVGIGQLTLALQPEADWYVQHFAQDWSAQFTRLDQEPLQAHWTDGYGGNLSVARADFLEAGGFAEDLARAYDIELAYRLMCLGCSFVYLREALGVQDERKDWYALITDSEKSGGACVALYRRHPPTLPVLLGAFPEQPPRWALAWRLLLALQVPAHRLESFRRILGRATETHAWFRFIHRYSFWRGVHRAIGSADAWRRLSYGTPILMYHAIGASGEPASRYVIPVHRFQQQMVWLTRMGYHVLSLEEYLHYRLTYRLPPARSVVITLDDGYEDNGLLAYPILRRFSFSATVFLVSSKIASVNDWDTRGALAGRPLLSWSQIQEMLQGGIQFGAHGRTHIDLTTLNPAKAQEEMAGARSDLERALGAYIQTFAYPYGKVNETLMALTQRLDFLGCCGTGTGTNAPLTSPYALRRVEIWGTDSLLRFAHALRYGARRGAWWKRRAALQSSTRRSSQTGSAS